MLIPKTLMVIINLLHADLTGRYKRIDSLICVAWSRKQSKSIPGPECMNTLT